MAEDRRAAHLAGMDGFAVKPLDPPRLFNEIAQVLHIEPPANRNEPTNTPVPSIDWPLGISLWGSKARLAKAMDRFLQAAPTQHPLPDDARTPVDWSATQLSLHGIHGAAGNLA
ncbi:hypothetical protein ACW4FQ_27170, partial [Escherichia coli]